MSILDSLRYYIRIGNVELSKHIAVKLIESKDRSALLNALCKFTVEEVGPANIGILKFYYTLFSEAYSNDNLILYTHLLAQSPKNGSALSLVENVYSVCSLAELSAFELVNELKCALKSSLYRAVAAADTLYRKIDWDRGVVRSRTSDGPDPISGKFSKRWFERNVWYTLIAHCNRTFEDPNDIQNDALKALYKACWKQYPKHASVIVSTAVMISMGHFSYTVLLRPENCSYSKLRNQLRNTNVKNLLKPDLNNSPTPNNFHVPETLIPLLRDSDSVLLEPGPSGARKNPDQFNKNRYVLDGGIIKETDDIILSRILTIDSGPDKPPMSIEQFPEGGLVFVKGPSENIEIVKQLYTQVFIDSLKPVFGLTPMKTCIHISGDNSTKLLIEFAEDNLDYSIEKEEVFNLKPCSPIDKCANKIPLDSLYKILWFRYLFGASDTNPRNIIFVKSEYLLSIDEMEFLIDSTKDIQNPYNLFEFPIPSALKTRIKVKEYIIHTREIYEQWRSSFTVLSKLLSDDPKFILLCKNMMVSPKSVLDFVNRRKIKMSQI